MSRSTRDANVVPEKDRHYIGDPPTVEHIIVPHDKYSWEREKQRQALGLKDADMADEPDEMSDHSDDQGFDNE